MAKKEQRVNFALECNECKHKNYISSKNGNTTKDKLSFNKYCKNCRKSTLHNESKLK